MSESGVKAYSVKRIADIAGVSKMTVYRYLKQNNIVSHHSDGNVKLYDEAVLKSVKDRFKADNQDIKESHVNADVTPDKKYVERLEKDLDAANAEKKKLLELLDQAQRLQLIAENKVKALEAPNDTGVSSEPKNKPVKADVSSMDESIREQEKAPREPKKGFWKRMFEK